MIGEQLNNVKREMIESRNIKKNPINQEKIWAGTGDKFASPPGVVNTA